MWALDQQSTKERMAKGVEMLTGTIFIFIYLFTFTLHCGVEMLTGTIFIFLLLLYIVALKCSQALNYFSKVLYTLSFYSKYTRALTSENSL
jgi:hypothetical protein